MSKKDITIAKSKTDEQIQDVLDNETLFDTNKDAMIYMLKYHKNIEQNVTNAFFDDSKRKKDYMVDQLRLGNLFYEAVKIELKTIIKLIQGKYMTYYPEQNKIDYKNLDKKTKEEIKQEIKQEAKNILNTVYKNAGKIKTLLYNDANYVALLNKNTKNNFFAQKVLDFGNGSDVEEIKSMLEKKNEEKVK